MIIIHIRGNRVCGNLKRGRFWCNTDPVYMGIMV